MQRLQEAQDKIRYETEIGTLQGHPVTLPPNHSKLQWHLQWHHPQSWPSPSPPLAHYITPPNYSPLQCHPAMAPSTGTTPAPLKLVVTPPPTIARYTGTQRWHHVHSPKVGRHHSTLQWHPAMAPSNGTTSTPPKLVVTLPLNHSTLQWHPTMAPSHGTTSIVPCNGTLVPRPIRQSGSSPSPYWK